MNYQQFVSFSFMRAWNLFADSALGKNYDMKIICQITGKIVLFYHYTKKLIFFTIDTK